MKKMKRLSHDVTMQRKSMVQKVFGELKHPPHKEQGKLEKVDSELELQFRGKRNSSKYEIVEDGERRVSGGGGRRSKNFYGNYGILST